MEDGAFPPDTKLGTLYDTSMDFDLMDELLLGGCWLETTDGSDFLQPDPSTSNSFFDSSNLLPTSDVKNCGSNPNPLENKSQEEAERSIFPKHPPLELQTENSVGTQIINSNMNTIAVCSSRSEFFPAEGSSELSRRWWIGPRENPGPVSSVRERLIQAVKYIRGSIKNGDVLVQVWVPVKRGDKQVLTTNDQPFSFDHNCQHLANYRNVSINYQFPVEGGSHEPVGLPGRVFLGKVPEWTPNVQFFSSDEFPRVNYAQRYNVHGTLGLPIFEQGTRSCLGVLEVVMTTQKTSYRPELENVCKALEAVDLRSSDVSSTPHAKDCNESYQAPLPEILDVLRFICAAHRLPLAQTWVPCIQQGKGGCRHSDENYTYCVSTVDSACYFSDHHMQEFHEACSEHHLIRGQGLAGRAFMTNQPCFSTDITAFSKKEYPLSHYARMFGLRAAVAIRLRSIYDRMADYVLEFFLPVDCRVIEEQKMMLNSMSTIIQQFCQSLRVITDKELEEETSLRIGEVLVPPDGGSNREERTKLEPVPSKGSSQEESSWIAHTTEAQQKGKSVHKEATKGFNVRSPWDNPDVVLQQGQTFLKQQHQDSGAKENIECGGDSSFGDPSFLSMAKTVEKRRTKMEKTVSLQVLRQYFAGSLKDAAKSIGVCPTTLKRICRQHGITRWPSRKIKKVGHSLRKLQVVIDSVQGAEGSLQIGSFYANFPELTSTNLPGSSLFSSSKKNGHLKSLDKKPEGGCSSQTAASKSPASSCSQSSSSSLCCSSGKQKPPHIANLLGGEDASMVKDPGGLLKRASSDAELHTLCQEELRGPARSHSHKSLSEHPNLESLPPLPKSSSQASHDRAALRVKVTYREEKVRFSMQPDWGFIDLQEEITKRFHIDAMNMIDIKYLDDDSEWVLLTCDDDLEECIDIYKSSQTRTIKLSIYQVSHPRLGSSSTSSNLS